MPTRRSDLGLIRTRATPHDDGSYRISGTKIFISAGEHDLTENIVHLVLARLPGAAPGTRGISLFVVPKLLPDGEGRPLRRNGVACGALEHKMGMKASATCVINFDAATGWLVGAPHAGMAAMFTMMNTERLGVGVQGLGVAEAAHRSAVSYARERLQVLVHPDVRRMLLTLRAYTEGMRGLGQWVAQALDRRDRHGDAACRAEADEFVALMTPVVKALFTDLGVECAGLGVQIFGGHGYIREHGVEQLLRDVRITQLYEGTNGIQALDLVRRKLTGGLLRRFFAPVDAFISAQHVETGLAVFVDPLAKAVAHATSPSG